LIRPRRYGDAGQAFPIYITVVGGLLFLAFAYFAVGQAAANRNGAQTAADAAALAAAQDQRDQLAGAWLRDAFDWTKWRDIFNGDAETLGDPCSRAHQLAASNDARVLGCDPTGLLGFTVEVETNKSVGESIVPGTAERRSDASATAVIESRCEFKPPGADAAEDALPRLSCGDRGWDLKPGDPPEILPKPEDLFDVHLANP
jgi:hypothetical protein